MDRNLMKVGDIVQLIEDDCLGEIYPWKKDAGYRVTEISGNCVRGLNGRRCCLEYSRFRIMTTVKRIQELAKEFAEDSVVLDALRTKYPEAFGYSWTITINDSYGPTTKHTIIGGRGDVSQCDVANEVARFLKGTIANSGRV